MVLVSLENKDNFGYEQRNTGKPHPEHSPGGIRG
jgi:hypothetical protein